MMVTYPKPPSELVTELGVQPRFAESQSRPPFIGPHGMSLTPCIARHSPPLCGVVLFPRNLLMFLISGAKG